MTNTKRSSSLFVRKSSKNIPRHPSPIQSPDRELCISNEPNSEEPDYSFVRFFKGNANDQNPPQLDRVTKLIIWNYKGANGQDFRRSFRSLINWHKPPLVALLETKMQDYLVLRNDFPFNRIIEVPTIGNDGGLVVMWDDALLELHGIATTEQEIHAIIKVRHKTKSLLYSCIYASPYRWKHKVLWQNLKMIKDTIHVSG